MKNIVAVYFLLTVPFMNAYGVGVCDAENAKRWEYLWANPSLGLRQRITAEAIRRKNIKTVIEVGGFCTPVCNYYKDSTYYNVDPFVHSTSSYECGNASLVKKGVENVRLADISPVKPFAVVMLGLYWEFIKDQDASKLPFVEESLKDASLFILEHVPNVSFLNKHVEQLINYAKSLGFKETISVDIDVLGKQPDPYAYYRQLMILEK